MEVRTVSTSMFLSPEAIDWKEGNLSIGPTASFQCSYICLNALSETGSLAPMKS